MAQNIRSGLRINQATFFKKMSYKILFICSLQGLLAAQQSSAANFYVSPSGLDSNSGTSTSDPVKTIRNALSRATRSGDIVYVMTGTYAENVTISQSGITLSALPNHFPVIDGGTTLPGREWGTLMSVTGNNNLISGFEIKNSNTRGVNSGGYAVQVGGHHNLLSRLNTHHTWANGIIINGDYNIVEDSMVWQTNQSNAVNPGSGWGSGLSAARNRSSDALIYGISSYDIFRRNRVYNNWGEGLSCYEADHCTIEDNIIYDNYAVSLYLSDASNSLVQRNIVYISSAPAITLRNSPGLTLADEVSSVPRSANNVIINNFIYNTHLQAFSWTIVPNSGLNNVLIANNTIVNGSLDTGSGGGSSIVNRNSQIRNNIVLGNSSVPSANGITFSNNNWSSTPAAAASPSNVSGDPRVAKTGSVAPGALTSAYFKFLAGSPVLKKGIALAGVKTDFFRVTRGVPPDIGGHEFSSSNTVPPSSNLSLNRPAVASSTQASDAKGSYNARYALDGNLTTRWSSAFADPQWITIDLGAPKQITRVVLNWETAFGKSYTIRVSEDNVNWTTIYGTTTGDGGIDDITGLSGSGRYIRMYGTARGTQWGYSLYEMDVYGY